MNMIYTPILPSFQMRPRISITGPARPPVRRPARPSVRSSVGDAFVKNKENRCFSTFETQGRP